MRIGTKRCLAVLGSLVLLHLACGVGRADDPAKDPITIATQKADAATVQADSAWMLISTALVLLMVPGLALFYGGMVRRKNVLTTMMHSFIAMAVIGVQWIVIGYALAFGKSQGGFIGW